MLYIALNQQTETHNYKKNNNHPATRIYLMSCQIWLTFNNIEIIFGRD